MTTDVTVYCGNGGDWEWFNERAIISDWLQKNVTKSFDIRPHKQGDKSIIRFNEDADAVKFFLLYSNYNPHLIAPN